MTTADQSCTVYIGSPSLTEFRSKAVYWCKESSEQTPKISQIGSNKRYTDDH